MQLARKAKAIVSIAPLFIPLLLWNCRGREKQVDLNRQQAEAIWTYHERVIERAIEKKNTDPAFPAACNFFTVLTGIEVRGEGSYFGWHASEETAEDLLALRHWFEDNRTRLRWEPESGQIGLVPASWELGAAALDADELRHQAARRHRQGSRPSPAT